MIFTYIKRFSAIIIFTLVLSGCLFPQQNLSSNQVPNEEQLNLVQTAVEQYSKETDGLLPIKTKTSDSPIFEKYIIDFDKLKELNILHDVPGNAYENGGNYQYVMITPEEDPQVKLIDLRVTKEVQKVNAKLEIYRSKHTYPPFGKEIDDGVFEINYEKIGLSNRPYVTSPFTQENLPIVMDVNGKLYIDYRFDLISLLEDESTTKAKDEDIRYLLTDDSPFVPAHSLPYQVVDGELVIIN